MTKLYPLNAVLSVATGRAFSTMDELQEILSHITESSIYTHQISRALEVCKPFLLDKFPELQSIEVPSKEYREKYWNGSQGKRKVRAWIKNCGSKLGYSSLEIPTLAGSSFRYEMRDPLEELESMTDKPVIVVYK